jgi:hypothetical protein
MTTIRVVGDSTLSPDVVLAAARDFSSRREAVFDAVSMERMEVHSMGSERADVTEGTSVGPLGVNWERCEYDWSEPGLVRAPVKDSNVYEPTGSTWEITAVPANGGSRVEMTWVRDFRRTPRGILFGTAFRTIGGPLFRRYARDILARMEETGGREA